MTHCGVQARMTDEAEDCILVAPSGLTCDEVTASSLVKLSPAGAVIDAGTTGLDVDTLSLSLHSALYMSPKRSDVKSIMHITSTNAVSVSTLTKCRLTIITDICINILYWDYCNSNIRSSMLLSFSDF